VIILRGKPGETKNVDNLGPGPIEIRILAIENGEIQLAVGHGPRISNGTEADRRSYRCTDLMMSRKQAD
jgi:hypothetical protein